MTKVMAGTKLHNAEVAAAEAKYNPSTKCDAATGHTQHSQN